jgi:hypothetical protein
MPADPDRFLRHGPIRISANRTHLAHTDGTPFFFLADTAWNGPLLSTDADWNTYLDDRAAKGFTAIQFITHAPWTAASANLEGQTAYTTGRRGAVVINPEFFDRIDHRIEAINARGLLAVPVLAWAANFGPSRSMNIGHTASARDLIPFIAFQVDRFARHQVLWLLAGDGVYNFWRTRKWKRVGRAVFGQSGPDRAPVCIHPAGLTWPYDSFADEPWLDFYGYQSSHSEHPRTLRWLQSGPPAQLWKTHPRPTINLEPVYEGIGGGPGGEPHAREAVRRAAYWSCLNAPTAGVAYGAHGLWGWHHRATEAMNHTGLGIGQPWHVAMNFPGSSDMGHLAGLFTSIKWWTLAPAPELLTSQPGQTDPARHIAISKSEAGDLTVAYVPRGGELPIRTAQSSQAQWFNPRTGEFTPAAAEPIAPTAEDWIYLNTTR